MKYSTRLKIKRFIGDYLIEIILTVAMLTTYLLVLFSEAAPS